jgi:formylglycine-generating enzyme required for sulfatase activity
MSVYWYLPDENEWYKAAYYDPSLTGSNRYWLYPTRSNAPPSSDAPPGGTDSANYFGPSGYVLTQLTTKSPTQNYLTDVGAYFDSPSAYGTYDQGGDVFQWNDLDGSVSSSVRGYRGGDFAGASYLLDATTRFYVTPLFSNYTTGFRVAENQAVPEPGSITLLLAWGAGLGVWRLRPSAKHLSNKRTVRRAHGRSHDLSERTRSDDRV